MGLLSCLFPRKRRQVATPRAVPKTRKKSTASQVSVNGSRRSLGTVSNSEAFDKKTKKPLSREAIAHKIRRLQTKQRDSMARQADLTARRDALVDWLTHRQRGASPAKIQRKMAEESHVTRELAAEVEKCTRNAQKLIALQNALPLAPLEKDLDAPEQE